MTDATPDLDDLVRRAREARLQAYAPYSGFRVGCALLAADGRVFTGANVENAAWSPSICAERVALPAAVVAGVRAFTALAVAGDGPAPCTPCGVCRQVLHEFAPDLLVLSAGERGPVERHVLGRDLLPHSFGAMNLADRRRRLLRQLETGEGFDRELLSAEGRQRMWDD